MKFPEKYRWENAPHGYATVPGNPFGMFQVPGRDANGRQLNIIAVDGEETGWEHVSVTVYGSKQTPSWKEMCIVKELFWEPSECVVQFHPPEEKYVNNHAGCLHLWRKSDAPFPMPPKICV